jgi:tRNA dimethylallyltransferase
MTFEEAIMGDAVATRQFAKRQMTWFKKFAPAVWFDLSQNTAEENAAKLLAASRAHLEGELQS